MQPRNYLLEQGFNLMTIIVSALSFTYKVIQLTVAGDCFITNLILVASSQRVKYQANQVPMENTTPPPPTKKAQQRKELQLGK